MPTPALTDSQLREAADAYVSCGQNKAAAARSLGMRENTYKHRLGVAISRGFHTGYDVNYPVPEGFAVTGISSLVDTGTGKAKLQWVKSSKDKERQAEILQEAYTAMCADIPRVAPTPPPVNVVADLCNQYTITDYHLGMLAWHKEGGADWDLNIATKTLIASFAAMMAGSPDTHTCIIGQLGDFLHSDGLLPVTPTSGHVLDQDGRFSKIVEAAITVLRQLVSMALEKHEHVHVIMAEGNHDMASSVWLRKMFKAVYENEPRISVNDSELPYYVYEWGKCMIGFSHSHTKKKEALPILFATEFSEIWGRTTYRVIHTGHNHHGDMKEHSGITVWQHNTLSARDSHASRGGWYAERKATSITYHKDFGQVATNEVRPEMISA